MNWLKTSARCPSAIMSPSISTNASIFADTGGCPGSTSAGDRLSCRNLVRDARTAIRFRSRSPTRPSTCLRTAARCLSYRRRCPADKGIDSTCSCLGGSSVATSSFVRRSSTGRTRRRNRASTSGAPSVSMGWRYVSVNASGLGNRPGVAIDSIDHRSMRLFSIGVPVTANFTRARNRRAALYVAACRFFTNCASSKITAPQGSAPYSSSSRRRSVYEVTMMSARALTCASGSARLALVRSTTSNRSPGANIRAWSAHVGPTEVGATTSTGGLSGSSVRTRRMAARSCTVFPRPMSSARIPPSCVCHRNASQRYPTTWYARSVAVSPSGTGTSGTAVTSRSPDTARRHDNDCSATTPSATRSSQRPACSARRRRPDAPPASSVASAITARSCSSSGRSRLNQVPPSRTRCASPLASAANSSAKSTSSPSIDTWTSRLNQSPAPSFGSVTASVTVGAASLYR